MAKSCNHISLGKNRQKYSSGCATPEWDAQTADTGQVMYYSPAWMVGDLKSANAVFLSYVSAQPWDVSLLSQGTDFLGGDTSLLPRHRI